MKIHQEVIEIEQDNRSAVRIAEKKVASSKNTRKEKREDKIERNGRRHLALWTEGYH